MAGPNRIDQSTVPAALRDDLERIRIIEATPNGVGIQFDTYPQEGHGLTLTLQGSNPLLPHLSHVDISSDWGATDNNNLLVGITAKVSNPAVGNVTGLQVDSENTAASGTLLSTAIAAQSIVDTDGGYAIGVGSVAIVGTGVSGTAVGFSAAVNPSGTPTAKYVVGLETDACIQFFRTQSVASVPPSSAGAVLYLKVVAGVFSLVADVNGTATVLAVG